MCCKVLGKQNHRCSQHDSLLRSLGVDVSSDKAEVHPEFFCNYCYLAAKKCCNQSSQTPSCFIEWLPHNDTHCNICDVRCKGGRPKKCSSRRPSLISTHIKSVALPVPSFTLAQVLDENYKDEITCSCCKGAIQTPVEILPCKSLYCCNCALSLATSSSFTCPCCSCMHQSIDSTFTKPSSIVEKMINSLSVKCDGCDMTVKVESLKANCDTHIKHHREELSKAVSHLLPRSQQTITVSTGGRVS